MPTEPSWFLLCITDIHYEQPDANFVDDPKELEQPAFREEIFTNFQNILENGFAPKSFDLVVVSGDLTTHGQEKGFKRFARQALPPLQRLVRSRQAICLVPGNHDVQWGLDLTERGSAKKKFRSFVKLVVGSGATSCLFPDKDLNSSQDEKLTLSSRGPGPLYLDRERKLIVLCINSSIRCGELNRSLQDRITAAVNNLFTPSRIVRKRTRNERLSKLKASIARYMIRDVAHVTAAQIGILSNQLTRLQSDLGEEWNSYLRVAVVHHHLVHFPGQITEHKGYELLVDSAQVLTLLGEFDFDLVLTGHKHQPYEVIHRFKDKELLLVGGPTLGGHPAGGSMQGIRGIDVRDRGEKRLFRIYDLPYGVGLGNVKTRVDECRNTIIEKECQRRPDAVFAQRAKAAGFSYRELASITVIDADGDARRVVECEDLVVHDSPRASAHPIHLPSTSGYLDQLRAHASGFPIRVEGLIPRTPRVKTWDSTLVFEDTIAPNHPASYIYQWYAVNSFALNKLQFDCLYGTDPGHLDNIEFTHLAIEDPIEDLTVVVRFPPGFQLKTPPRLRIAEVDPAVKDARKWKIDKDLEQALAETHALRYYESLNIAALRVKYPQPNVSYGIQWEVPDSPSRETEEFWKIRDLRDRLKSVQLNNSQHEQLVRLMARIIIATRRSFLRGWEGPVDGGLMYFDGETELPLLVAAEEDRGDSGELEARELLYQANLRYGDGIAGRAFKSNRLRVYVAPDQADASDTPDYYIPLPNCPDHQVLISMPIHMPESEEAFQADPRIYESKTPYGVVNLGSERVGCPLTVLRLQDNIAQFLCFQHDVSKVVYQHLEHALGAV